MDCVECGAVSIGFGGGVVDSGHVRSTEAVRVPAANARKKEGIRRSHFRCDGADLGGEVGLGGLPGYDEWSCCWVVGSMLGAAFEEGSSRVGASRRSKTRCVRLPQSMLRASVGRGSALL